MLVLSRRQNQTIRIGADITITLVAIKGDQVRIGIEAPADVPVHRSEVAEALDKSGRKFHRKGYAGPDR